MAEVLRANLDSIISSDIHACLNLQRANTSFLSAHREENIDTEKNFLSLFNAVNRLAEKYDMPISTPVILVRGIAWKAPVSNLIRA
jgi:UDP-N-acetylglucosamine 2-epimerase (non-hydrolysing)